MAVTYQTTSCPPISSCHVQALTYVDLFLTISGNPLLQSMKAAFPVRALVHQIGRKQNTVSTVLRPPFSYADPVLFSA